MLKPNIQLFAESTEEPNAGNGGNPAQDGGNSPKTFTQADVDKIVNERTERAAKAAMKSFFQQKGLSEDEAALISACAQLMCVLSRLAEDMILFSMPEFGYFRLPREYCTGSSIMPQKFNPDVLELVRGKAAQVVGLSTAALSLLHAMPGGYNRDLQDCKLLYMKAVETTRTTLRIMTKVVKGMEIDEAKLRAGFTPGVFATDVALRMVAQGKPWREAYHEVRDHLERLKDEDPDAAVAAKTHEGTTGGLDYKGYEDLSKSERWILADKRRAFLKCLRNLLG